MAKTLITSARRTSNRRGGIVVMVATSLTMLLGFAALVFDLGYMRMVRTQLQMSTAAITHAAVSELDQTSGGLDLARDAALAVAAYQVAGGHSIDIEASDVELGYWDEDLGEFVADESVPGDVSAVRLSTSVQVPLFLGGYVFADTDYADGIEFTSTSVVTQGTEEGAETVTCVLPVAIPLCAVDADDDGDIDNPTTLRNKTFDAGACASAATSGHGQAMMTTNKSIFNNTNITKVVNCDSSMSVGDDIYVQTDAISTSVNTGLTALANEIIGASDSWNSTLWGTAPNYMSGSKVNTSTSTAVTVMEQRPIPVVDTEDSSWCSASGGKPAVAAGTRFEVVGFIWGAAYDVKWHTGALAGSVVTSCGSTPTNALRIRVRLDTEAGKYLEPDASPGGPDYGVTAPGVTRIIPIE